MPPRPFPHPFTTGVDICHVTRLGKYIPPLIPSHSSATTSSSSSAPKVTSEAKATLHLPYPAFPVRYPTLSEQSQERNTTPTSSSFKSSSSSSSSTTTKDLSVAGIAATTVSAEEEAAQSRQLIFKFFGKTFTVNEQREFWMRFSNWNRLRLGKNGIRDRALKFLGGRWAAKEAIIKAYSPQNRQLFFRDIEIHVDPTTRAPFGVVLDWRQQYTDLDKAVTIYEDCMTELERASKETEEGGEEAKKIEERRVSTNTEEAKAEYLWERMAESPGTPPSANGKETKPILSSDGILDFGAVVEALEDDSVDKTDARNEPPISQQAQDGKGFDVDVDGQVVMVSISHDGEYAIATALAPVVDGAGAMASLGASSGGRAERGASLRKKLPGVKDSKTGRPGVVRPGIARLVRGK